MIELFVITAALACPETSMVNTSGYPWNDYDRSILTQTKRRCVQIYPDSPCVKMFKKWGKQDYSVVCGAKKTVDP